MSRTQKTLYLEKTGQQKILLTLTDLKNIFFGDVVNPKLYDIVTTLFIEGRPFHDFQTRIRLGRPVLNWMDST